MRSMAVALAVILLLPARAPAAKLPPPNKLALVQAQCGRCQCGADADCGTGGSCVGSVCVAGDLAANMVLPPVGTG